MRTLTLLRHAKAMPYGPGIDDHERPLNERGNQAAEWVGRQTRHRQPDLALCSTALRTRQTLDRIGAEWGGLPPTEYEPRLYLARPQDLLARLGEVGAAVASVWLIGHNPGLHDLAARLAERAGHHAALAEHFPTAARAVFRIDCADWSGLAAAAELIEYVTPPRD